MQSGMGQQAAVTLPTQAKMDNRQQVADMQSKLEKCEADRKDMEEVSGQLLSIFLVSRPLPPTFEIRTVAFKFLVFRPLSPTFQIFLVSGHCFQR